MNKNSSIYKLYKKLKYEWGHLDFATKCIFFIGILLLFQLIYAIFVPANALDSTTQIVFRTSTSSIFGFILGMAHSYSTKKASPPSEESEDHEKQEFVFNKDINLNKATHVRILFSTTVCIMCIIVLMIANRTNNLSYQEGIIQLRDLISTTIGFLISKASHHH